MFTCFSCLLMVWHTIVLLLMFCYDYDSKQVANWAFWRDFAPSLDQFQPGTRTQSLQSSGMRCHGPEFLWLQVRNYRDSQDEERLDFVGLYKLQLLCKMYKSKDFDDSEVVAKLPCALLDFGLSSWMRSWLWFWWWFADVEVTGIWCVWNSVNRVLNGHLHGLISRLLDEYQIRQDSKRPSEAWLARAAEVSIIPEPDLEAANRRRRGCGDSQRNPPWPVAEERSRERSREDNTMIMKPSSATRHQLTKVQSFYCRNKLLHLSEATRELHLPRVCSTCSALPAVHCRFRGRPMQKSKAPGHRRSGRPLCLICFP
ncbi:unnamed protein product [Symbiodinium microadriaticum]|nr:unnamed protein product [Symbiodinium microadriaticum]